MHSQGVPLLIELLRGDRIPRRDLPHRTAVLGSATLEMKTQHHHEYILISQGDDSHSSS